MKDPKTKIAKFLKALIDKKEVSIKTFGESSMRSRISDLRLDYGSLRVGFERWENCV